MSIYEPSTVSLTTFHLAQQKGLKGPFTHDFKVVQTHEGIQRWLRTEHDIIMFVEPSISGWRWMIYYNQMRDGKHGYERFEKWEDAMEDGLRNSIDLIPNTK